MSLPVLARKVKKLASCHIFNLKMMLNGDGYGRGFSKFKKNYKLKGELGRGGFGVVYRAVRIADDFPVAVKFIDRRSVKEWGKVNDEDVPMEICMLAKCAKIKGVIRLLDWFSVPEGFLIVMERPYPSMDMFDLIKLHGQLSEDTASYLLRQVAQTLQACADRRVLHRDIKDENLVVDLLTGDVRLVDFGAATLLKKSHYTDFQGTRLYCPPEWFLHSLYLGREAAVWSFGVLLYNALNGRLPFKNEKDICTAHLLGPLPYYASVSPEARDLISRCLSFDPFSRCSLDEILVHPWLNSSLPDWNTLSSQYAEEQLEEIPDEEEEERSHTDDSAVGSSNSGRSRTGQTRPAAPRQKISRAAKTSLLVPPSNDELKEVVVSSKTRSQQGAALLPRTLPRRRQQQPDSTVLVALRRAISRERQRKAQ